MRYHIRAGRLFLDLEELDEAVSHFQHAIEAEPENGDALHGLGLCAECGLVSALHATGGGSLVAFACVDYRGDVLMPCGRCRQLLWENGGPSMLLETARGVLPMTEVLPDAFGADDLEQAAR